MGFEVTDRPLPFRPCDSSGEGLHCEGWQMAVIVPDPGKLAPTSPEELALTVSMLVETYSRLSPVMVTPFVSTTVAFRGCAMFWFTVMLVDVVFGTLSVMFLGGQVKYTPAGAD